MIRVAGGAELYVDVSRDPDQVVLLGPGKSRLLSMDPAGARGALGLYDELRSAEWELGGLAGVPARGPVPPRLLVDVLPFPGLIRLRGTGVTFTAVQSEHLRSLLSRAYAVLSTGVGDMGDQ